MATLARELRSKHWQVMAMLLILMVIAAVIYAVYVLSGASFNQIISNDVVGGLMWKARSLGLMW